MPSPGRILHLRPPSGPGVRDDGGYDALDEVPILYDSLVSKLIAWGRDAARRDRAHAPRACRVRDRRHPDDLPFFRWLLDDPDFLEARVSTRRFSIARWPPATARRSPRPAPSRRPRGDWRRARRARLRAARPSRDRGVHVGLDARRQARGAAGSRMRVGARSRRAARRHGRDRAPRRSPSPCGWTGSRSASRRRRSPAGRWSLRLPGSGPPARGRHRLAAGRAVSRRSSMACSRRRYAVSAARRSATKARGARRRAWPRHGADARQGREACS